MRLMVSMRLCFSYKQKMQKTQINSQLENAGDLLSKIPGPSGSGKPLKMVVVTAIVLLIGFLIYGLAWRILAARIEQQITSLSTPSETNAFILNYKSLTVSGFPGWLKSSITQPKLYIASTKKLLWTSDVVFLKTRPWDFSTIDFNASGQHTVYKNKSIYDIKFDQLSGTINSANGLKIELRSDGIKLPKNLRLILGRDIKSFALSAQLNGLLKSLQKTDVEKWRDGGGTVELERFNIIYGSLKLNSKGTLSLDKNLQPIGALSARIIGHQETIDALRNARIINSTQAFTARLIFAAMQKSSPLGPQLDVPISIQDQKLSIGPAAVMTLPDLWQ